MRRERIWGGGKSVAREVAGLCLALWLARLAL